MIPIRIQCGCGQLYEFEVEPVNGLMPSSVACPVCGIDGTAAANESIAQTLATQPTIVPSTAPPPHRPALSQQAARPNPRRPIPQTGGSKDGWATEESQLNKLGTFVTVGSAILAALLSWGLFGFEIPATTLFIVVGVAGLVGGALNIAGRGPVWAGAAIDFLIAIGGYGAVFWWIHDRTSVRKFELLLAFVIGAAPGFLIQYVLQQILRKRS
jgi:hypothetical protein